MTNEIHTVTLVSDGILVAFTSGTQCYFPASFLEANIGLGSNQTFLPYDPSAPAHSSIGAELHRQPSGLTLQCPQPSA